MNKTKRILLTVLAIMALIFAMSISAFAADTEGNVAKVGNTEYATIDEAVANWTNGSTLTLLSDVTLSDVVTFKSTEHHILNLGTYTMTAASGKHAIEITCDGRSSASYALTVNADSENPGGITATGKSCIYYKKSDSTKDRPIILINNGVFTGSYSLNITSNGNTNCPQVWINGGTFNSYVNLTKTMLKVSGGTFHAAINCTGDSSAYREIKGGRFKSWQFMTADAPTKFWVGSGNGNYNVGVYVDTEGYLVVGGPVITELSEEFPAVATNYSKWSSYLKYSSAATYGLYYQNADQAIAKHGEANVTVYVKPAVTIPTGMQGAVVEQIKNNTALNGYTPENVPENAELVIELVSAEETVIVFDVAPMEGNTKVEPTEAIIFRLPVPSSVTTAYAKVYHEGDFIGIYAICGEENAKYVEISSAEFSKFTVEPTSAAPVAAVNGAGYATFAEALAAAKAMTGDVTVEIYEKVTLNTSLTGNYASIKFVGKSETAEIYLDIQGYSEATGKTVAFEDLKLSKVAGGYITNAGFMNLAFGVYAAESVSYTNCIFLNGAYASKGTATFTGCTFYRSHDRYGFWAYGEVNVTIDGCTFADFRGIKMYSEGKLSETAVTVKNTDFSAVNNKPAIVLTYGLSVTLENNTYSSTGVFELDLDGAPNGVTVTSDVAPTCINDNGACGVLVDGKIYTTAAQAKAVATSGSKVTLLHNSAETVEFAAGVELNKNGYAAEGVTVEKTLLGSGTEADPYKIGTAEDLFFFAEKVNNGFYKGAYVILIADIDLEQADWTSIGTASNPFMGTFDGNGKTISNLWCYERGLFGYTSTGNYGEGDVAKRATIKNLTLVNVTVINNTNADAVGGVVGQAGQNTVVTGVTVKGEICINAYRFVGAIVGQGYVQISDCHVDGGDKEESSITARYWAVAGICGHAGAEGGSSIKNCSAKNITVKSGSGGAAGIAGCGTKGPVENNSAENIYVDAPDWNNGIISGYVSNPVGSTASNVTFKEGTPKDACASVNGEYYFSLSAAFAAVTSDYDTVVVYKNVTENLVGAYLRGNIVTANGAKVTITLTNADWVYLPYTFVIGENVTLKANALFYYAGGSQINGTVITNAYYQRYAGTKLTINEPGSMTVTTEQFYLRYTDNDANAGIYINGDNNEETVGLKLAVAYFYQGMISAKDANIVAGTYWQTNETDGAGSANLVLDNSTLTVTVSDHPMKATGNSTVTLKNGSKVSVANGYTGVAVAMDATSSFTKNGTSIFVATTGGYAYTTLSAAIAAANGGEVVVLRDVTEYFESLDNVTLVAGNANGVTITNTNADTWVSVTGLTIRSGVTLHMDNALFDDAGVNVIEGTLIIDTTFYNAYDSLTTVQNGGKVITGGMIVVRYNYEQNTGLYVYGDGNDETVEISCADTIGTYSGTFYAENAVVEGNMLWLDYKKGSTEENDKYSQINASFVNSVINVTSEFRLYKDASLTLSGSKVTAGKVQVRENATPVVNVTNSTIKAATVENLTGATINAVLTDGFVTFKVAKLLGSGTEADPYQIGSVEDLIFFRDSVNSGDTKFNAPGVYVALTADIDLAGIDWSVNIGDDCSATFDGIFDGKDHIIYNLTSTETAKKADGYICTGLFGAIYGSASIKNLTLENVTINTGDFAGNNVGALVGFAYSCTGTIENVTVNNATINAAKATGVGAIVGYDYYGKLTISDCEVNDAEINGKAYVGGIVGYLSNNATITDCTVQEAEISAVASAGGIAGIALGGVTVKDSTVKNVSVAATGELWANSAAIAVGTIAANTITVSNVTAENVNVTAMVGGVLVEQPTEPIKAVQAKIGDTYYATLEAAMAAANAGETITIIANASNIAISVAKNVTITGNDGIILNNVSINAVDGCTELIVSNLTFTGNSWINSGAASKLTVSGVVAEVTPSNTAYTNSRSAFISLGRSEQMTLELTVENCNIVSLGGSDPILGWACIKKATITGNTFGSASAYQTNSDSVKFMSIANGAEFTITGNTVYSNYNGFVFAQNTTRNNAYSVYVDGNTFVGGADHIWIEISGGNTCHVTLNATSNNTVNGNTFTVADIKYHSGVIKAWTSYAGVDIVTNENGKVIGGTLAYYAEDAIAEGYKVLNNGKVVAGVIEVTYKDGTVAYFNNILDAVPFKTNYDILEGATIKLLDDYTGSGIRFCENDMVLDLNGFTYTINEGTGSNTTRTSALQIRPEVTTKTTIKNGTIKIATASEMNETWGSIAYMINNYAAELIVENVTLDMANMTWSYGTSVYAIVSREGDNVKLTGTTAIINFNNEIGGNIISNAGDMTIESTVSVPGTIKLDAGATLTAPEGLDVTAPEGYVVAYANGTYSLIIPAAKIGDTYYATIKEAIAAVQDGQTVEILAGTYSEGSIKLPSALKNVTIKGAEGTILKDMTITSADGSSVSYEGLTIDGIVFDNSNIVLTGWRTGTVVYKDITVTNCTFKNVVRTNNEAAFHINVDATEAVNGFTFTNNVIDGVSGASNSGVYAQLTGNVVFTNNTINNVAFRPYVIQITTDDGIADSFVVTGNTFSGSAVGRAQGLGSNASGTDAVSLVVSNNIFKGITGAQQICYWNFNPETTTAVLSKNYYDIDIIANPSRIYFNSAAQDLSDLVEMGIFPIYTALNENGTIDVDSKMEAPCAVVNDVYYASLEAAIAAAQAGETVTLLADVTLSNTITIAKSITLDGNGFAIVPADASKTYNSAIMVGDSGWGDDHGETITIKNLKVAGWKTEYGAIRAQGVTLAIEGCTFTSNSVTNAAYAVLSLNFTDATVTNTSFVENTSRAIDVNYNGDNSKAVVTIDGCTFNANSTTTPGIVMRSAGTLVLENSKFINNVVNTNGNGATVYVGFGSGHTVSGCYFEGNTVVTSHTSTKRFASAIFCDGCVVENNVFGEGNTATRNNEAISTIVAVGAYYGAADLSGNYWGGNAPVPGTDYTIEYTRYNVALNSYYADAELTEKVELTYVAKVGKYSYTSLADAIAAANAGDTVTLIADANECVSITKNITLDLNGNKVFGNGSDAVSVTNGATVTIKNGTLESNGDNCGGVYVKNATLYLENCTAIGTNAVVSCAVYASNGANVTITNCNLSANHYALVMMSANVKIVSGEFSAPVSVSANGSDAYDDANLTINGGTFNGGIYWPANGKLTINDGSFTGKTAIYFKSGSLEINGGTFIGNGEKKDYEHTLSRYESTGAAIVIENVGADEYDAIGTVSITGGTFKSENNVAIQSVTAGKANVEAITGFISGGSFSSDVNALCADGFICVANGNMFGVKEGQFVAEVNGVKYETLEAAFKAATSGCTIEILDDVTIDYYWDCRNTGSKFTVPVTINGNNKTIKFTNTVYDGGNYMSAFRFEAGATVNDLTIDMSEALSGFAGRIRAISAKGDLTVDNCTFIGNASYTNTRAIISGEGSQGGANVVITNSTFTNWTRAISDNENAKDANTVTITGNTFENASVNVSAKNTIVFNENEMTSSSVKLVTYTKEKLSVTAQGNTIDAAGLADSVIRALYINAQPEIPVEKIVIGSITPAFTGTNSIWGEGGGNATESLVIELYSGETLLVTATLNDPNKVLLTGNTYVSWSIPLNNAGNDEWWTIEWENYITAERQPTKVVMIIDGVKTAENNYQLNSPDDLNKIYAATVDKNGNFVQYYTSLTEAMGKFNGRTVAVLRDVTADITGFYGVTLISGVKGGVTITNTYTDEWIDFDDVTIGSGVTLNATDVYSGDSENVILGTFNVTGTYYHAYDAKTTIKDGGKIVVDGTTILRYNKKADAGIYVYGDNDDSTVEFYSSYYVGAYSGTFYAKNANVSCGYFLLKNSYDNSNYADVALVLDNSTLTVVGTTDGQDSFHIDDKASISLTNGSAIADVRDFNILAGADLTLTVDSSSSISATNVSIAQGVPFAKKANGDGTFGIEKTLLGSGTENDPYQIGSVEDLIFFRDSVNAGDTKFNAPGVYVALTADIDLAGIDWSVNIGDDCSATFDGIFDGKDHIIYNLTSTETAKKADGYICTGLFGAIYGSASIKNLTLENVTINTGDFAGNNVGALVGFAYSCTGTIENVTVNNATINAANATGVGAIVGYDYYGKLTISGCKVNDAAINGKAYVGGIVGYLSNNATITDCTVQEAEISAVASAGGIAGIALGGVTVKDSTVKNVSVAATGELWANSAAIAVGTIAANTITVSNVTAENVNVTAMVGGVLVEQPTEPIKAVQAKIGDTYYATLEAALTAANAGDTVTLLAPIVIEAGETVEIDLKGVTISYTSNVVGQDMITNNGKLTINDSVGGGKIIYTNTDTTGSNVTVSTISTVSGSTLVVNGGIIENKTVKADGSSIYSYAIDILTNGANGDVTVTINGGTVYSDYMAIRQFNNGNVCKNTLNVNGGYIYGAKRAIQVHFDNNAAYLTISGGKIEGGSYSLCLLTTSENISVTGGEFIGDVWYSGENGFISGGSFSSNVNDLCADGFICVANGNMFGVKEGQFVAEVDGVKYESFIEALQTAIDNGASEVKVLADIREKMAYDFDLVIKADLTITADAPVKVEFYNEGTAYDFAVGSTNGNKLTIAENVSFDLTDRVIWLGYYGNNVDVVVDGYLGGYQIWHGADTTVSATGTLDSHGEAFIMRRDATLTVNGGTVEANYFTIYSGHIVAKDADISAGLVWIRNSHSYGNEGTVSIELDNTSFISRGVVEIDAGEGKEVNVTLANGSTITATGSYKASANVNAVADAASAFTANNKSVFVATANGYQYTSLQAALNAGGTVTLLKDIVLTEGVTVAAGKTVTLDLAGHTVSTSIEATLTKSFALITNKGTLTIADSVGDGKVSVAYTGASFGYGCGLYTISNEGGTLNITGGTIENLATVSGSMYDAIDNNSTLGYTELNISGGNINCAYIAIRQFANNTNDNVVNVTGGTITGGNCSIWTQNPGSGAPKASIAISGGDFSGRILLGESANFAAAITGGTYTVDVSEFCADGYVCEANGDGTYGVRKATYVAEVNGVKYETLADAIAAATANDTIVIIAEVIDFAENAASIVIDKPLTIKGAGKDATTLNFNSATSAFVIESSDVTFADMTITQGTKSNSFHISISKGAWDAPAIQYSNIVIDNIAFVGGNYALCLIGENIIVDSCEFTTQSSHNIIIYSVKGNTQIINNVFNASTGSNKSAILYEGGVSTTLTGDALAAFLGGGSLEISGNEAYNKGVFFQFTNWSLVENMSVEISDNLIDGITNKAIAIYTETPSVASGREFAEFVVKENVFKNIASGRTIIKEYTGTVEVLASGNYLGSETPDYAALLVGDKVVVENYYADEELTILVEIAAKVVSINGVGYTSLQAAIDAAVNGDTIVVLESFELTEGVVVPAGKVITLDLAGFDITMTLASVNRTTFAIKNNGTLTITNSTDEVGEICLTYTGERNSNASISTIGNYGTLNIAGGKINCVAGNQAIAYAIDTFSVTNEDIYVNISGGEVCGGASGYSIRMFLGSTTYNNELNVTGGKVGYVWAQNTNANANKATIDVTTGGNVAYIYVAPAGSSTFDVSNITLNVKADYTEYAPFVGISGDEYALRNVDGVYKIVKCNYVAQDANGVKYESLQAALNAGGTVTLLADITLTESVTVTGTVVLDLAGYTISQEKACTESYAMINNLGNLTITGNGVISLKDTGDGDPSFNWGSYTIRNEGTLVVDNGTIEHLGAQNANGVVHMYCAIFQYSGSTTVNGGTISTPTYRSVRLWKGEMTINGGTFNGQVWVQAVDDTASLTIAGGSFAPRGVDGSSVFVENEEYDVEFLVTGGTFATKIGCSDPLSLMETVQGGKFTQSAMDNTSILLIADGFEFILGDNDMYDLVEMPVNIADFISYLGFSSKEDGSAIIVSYSFNYEKYVTYCEAVGTDVEFHTYFGTDTRVNDTNRTSEINSSIVRFDSIFSGLTGYSQETLQNANFYMTCYVKVGNTKFFISAGQDANGNNTTTVLTSTAGLKKFNVWDTLQASKNQQ